MTTPSTKSDTASDKAQPAKRAPKPSASKAKPDSPQKAAKPAAKSAASKKEEKSSEEKQAAKAKRTATAKKVGKAALAAAAALFAGGAAAATTEAGRQGTKYGAGRGTGDGLGGSEAKAGGYGDEAKGKADDANAKLDGKDGKGDKDAGQGKDGKGGKDSDSGKKPDSDRGNQDNGNRDGQRDRDHAAERDRLDQKNPGNNNGGRGGSGGGGSGGGGSGGGGTSPAPGGGWKKPVAIIAPIVGGIGAGIGVGLQPKPGAGGPNNPPVNPPDPNPPTLISVDPDKGPAGGGQKITLHGTHFAAPASVTIGGVPARNLNVVSDKEITVDTPQAVGPLGQPVAVTVTTPAGTATLPNGYTYNAISIPAPTLTNLNPPQGYVRTGTAVQISGSNFIENGTQVFFGDREAVSVQFQSTGLVIATTPSDVTVPAQVEVKVTTEGGTAGGLRFTYQSIPAPTITNFDPIQGTISGSTSVDITGTNFIEDDTRVFFGDKEAASVVFTDTQHISAVTPSAPAGPVRITVRTSSGQVTSLQIFTYIPITLPTPTIDNVTPPNGSIEGGNPVTIRGSNFALPGEGPVVVTFGSAVASNVTVRDAGTIIAYAPQGQPGSNPGEPVTVDITVENPNHQIGVKKDAYTYDPLPTPQVRNLSISSGQPGDQFHVIGENFRPGSQVTFDEMPGQTTFVNVGDLQVTVPQLPTTMTMSRTPRSVKIVVVNPDKQPSRENVMYGYRDPQPLISGPLDPPQARAGDTVLIRGSYFVAGQTRVSFAQLPATVTKSGPDSVEVAVPSGLPINTPVSVQIHTPAGDVTAFNAFTCLPSGETVAGSGPNWQLPVGIAAGAAALGAAGLAARKLYKNKKEQNAKEAKEAVDKLDIRKKQFYLDLQKSLGDLGDAVERSPVSSISNEAIGDDSDDEAAQSPYKSPAIMQSRPAALRRQKAFTGIEEVLRKHILLVREQPVHVKEVLEPTKELITANASTTAQWEDIAKSSPTFVYDSQGYHMPPPPAVQQAGFTQVKKSLLLEKIATINAVLVTELQKLASVPVPESEAKAVGGDPLNPTFKPVDPRHASPLGQPVEWVDPDSDPHKLHEPAKRNLLSELNEAKEPASPFPSPPPSPSAAALPHEPPISPIPAPNAVPLPASTSPVPSQNLRVNLPRSALARLCEMLRGKYENTVLSPGQSVLQRHSQWLGAYIGNLQTKQNRSVGRLTSRFVSFTDLDEHKLAIATFAEMIVRYLLQKSQAIQVQSNSFWNACADGIGMLLRKLQAEGMQQDLHHQLRLTYAEIKKAANEIAAIPALAPQSPSASVALALPGVENNVRGSSEDFVFFLRFIIVAFKSANEFKIGTSKKIITRPDGTTYEVECVSYNAIRSEVRQEILQKNQTYIEMLKFIQSIFNGEQMSEEIGASILRRAQEKGIRKVETDEAQLIALELFGYSFSNDDFEILGKSIALIEIIVGVGEREQMQVQLQVIKWKYLFSRLAKDIITLLAGWKRKKLDR